jgi:hypothetical protein
VPETPKLVLRREFLVQIARGKRVLHLGCTDAPYTREAIAGGTFLHAALAEAATDICGLDGDSDGIKLMQDAGFENIIQGDLENLDRVSLPAEPDLIIAGEMIEHLNNPGLFLSGVKRLMSPETRLVVTTVNAYCGMRFFRYGLRGKGGTAEPVHPDHVAYYSYSTLNLLLRRHGMRVEEFLFYDIGKEHRPFLRPALNFINDVCVRIAPQWSDGLIAICRVDG